MGRAPCCDKNGLKKGPWTSEEDQKLVDYIQKHGHGSWRTLPKNAGLARCGKSCRLRWTNYLRPDIKRGRFSFEEEETIIQLHSILGNKWSAIAARLPGRTDNEIKNYWNTHIRKRLLRMGIDPVTHNPRLDLLDLSTLLTNTSLYNAAHLDVSRLLGGVGIDPFVNYPELLKIASNLLSNQCQQDSSNLGLHQNLQEPAQIANNSQIQDPFQSQFLNESQFMQANVSNFQPCHDQTNMWHDNAIQANFSENLVPATNIGYNNLEQPVANFASDDSNIYLPNIPNYNLTASVLSTPASSPTQLNSSSTYNLNSSSTEDERDSYCSDLLRFQVPDLLDVSEFL